MSVLFTPAMFLRMFVLVQIQAYFGKKQLEEYGEANLVSQEALNGIQTVHAYNAIDHEHNKYTTKLDRVMRFGLKKALFEGNGRSTDSKNSAHLYYVCKPFYNPIHTTLPTLHFKVWELA